MFVGGIEAEGSKTTGEGVVIRSVGLSFLKGDPCHLVGEKSKRRITMLGIGGVPRHLEGKKWKRRVMMLGIGLRTAVLKKRSEDSELYENRVETACK